jgi:hypothetical protein
LSNFHGQSLVVSVAINRHCAGRISRKRRLSRRIGILAIEDINRWIKSATAALLALDLGTYKARPHGTLDLATPKRHPVRQPP